MTPPMNGKTALEELTGPNTTGEKVNDLLFEMQNAVLASIGTKADSDRRRALTNLRATLRTLLAPPVVVGEDDGATALVNRLYEAADDLAVMPQAGDAQKARTMREAAALIAVLDTGSTNLGNRLTALSAELAGVRGERDYAWGEMKNAQAYWRTETNHAEQAEARAFVAEAALEVARSMFGDLVSGYRVNHTSKWVHTFASEAVAKIGGGRTDGR